MKNDNRLLVTLDEGATMPTRAHADDAGLDLYANETCTVVPGYHEAIDTGTHVWLPHGYVGLVCPRSGLNINSGVFACLGVIDAGYTGTIKVGLYNMGREPHLVERGDRIAQLVVVPVWYLEPKLVESLPDSERGADGYGSTGR